MIRPPDNEPWSTPDMSMRGSRIWRRSAYFTKKGINTTSPNSLGNFEVPLDPLMISSVSVDPESDF